MALITAMGCSITGVEGEDEEFDFDDFDEDDFDDEFDDDFEEEAEDEAEALEATKKKEG